jgi:hypothetical protein
MGRFGVVAQMGVKKTELGRRLKISSLRLELSDQL